MSVAAEYVATGMAVVAIPKGKKSPVNYGWNRRDKAITAPEVAAGLTENIGLLHAYCSPAPTMALDVDDMVRAAAWLAELGIDVAELLDADNAVQIVSGRPARAKLLYRLPFDLGPIESLAIKEMANVDGEEKQITVLEFRCATRDGLTVQDVLPPSIHPDTGLCYSWGGKGDWRKIPEIPAALLVAWQVALAAQGAHRARRKRQFSFFKGVEDTPRQRARVQEMLRHVSADCSYELYRDMVWALLSLGWHDGEEIAEGWCRTAPDRFEDHSFHDVVASYDQTRTPTYGTIHYHARAGGWNG